jgi:hypothetical protein
LSEFDDIARGYLANEREHIQATEPLQQPVIVAWRNVWRVGGIAELRQDGICLLAITSSFLPKGFARALMRLDPARLVYRADAALDLTGRQHIVARRGNRIIRMTDDQTAWAANHIGSVTELQGAGSMEGRLS